MSDGTQGSEHATAARPGAAEAARRRADQGDRPSGVRSSIDGTGRVEVATGLPFFDHMLEQLGRHGGFDLAVRGRGGPPRRRPPHRRGRGHRARRVPGRGPRRQGRHPAVRLAPPAPRRGAGGGGPRPVGPALPGLRRPLRPRHPRAGLAAVRPPAGRGVLAGFRHRRRR